MEALKSIADYLLRRPGTVRRTSKNGEPTTLPRQTRAHNPQQKSILPTAAPTLYVSASQPPRHPGHHFIWILRHVYERTIHATAVRRQLQICDDAQNVAIAALNGLEAKLDWLRTDTRIFAGDFSEFAEQWMAKLEETKKQQNLDEVDATLHKDELQLTEKLKIDGWKALHLLSQDYVNSCLDANFDESWCLGHGACMSLRNLAHYVEMVEKRRSELTTLTRLRTSRVAARSRSRNAVETTKATFPSSETSESLERSNNNRASEISQAEMDTRISALRVSLQCSEQSLKEKEAIFLKEDVKPYLESMTSTTRGDGDYPHPEREQDLSSSRRSPSNEDWEDPYRLSRWYLDVRARHQALQAEYASELKDARALEPDHLMTFTNSSRARFSEYVDSLLADLRRDLRDLEAQRYEMHDRILEMGIKLPEPDDIDSFRFSTRQSRAADTAATPPSGDGLRDVPDYEQRSEGSPSASPSSARKRRLREYEKLQSSERRKKAKMCGSGSREGLQVNK